MKHYPRGWACSGPDVAPRAGAWIETALNCRKVPIAMVAPRAGAWIETRFPLEIGGYM